MDTVRALPGERLSNPKAKTPPLPSWTSAPNGAVAALAATTTARLDAFRKAHPAAARKPGPRCCHLCRGRGRHEGGASAAGLERAATQPMDRRGAGMVGTDCDRGGGGAGRARCRRHQGGCPGHGRRDGRRLGGPAVRVRCGARGWTWWWRQVATNGFSSPPCPRTATPMFWYCAGCRVTLVGFAVLY